MDWPNLEITSKTGTRQALNYNIAGKRRRTMENNNRNQTEANGITWNEVERRSIN